MPQDSGADQRQFTRIPFNESVQFRITDFDSFDGSLGRDISQGGIRILTQFMIPVNTIISLKLPLKEKQPLVDVKGRVVWVKINPYSEQYESGLEFHKEDQAGQEELRQFMVKQRYPTRYV